MPLLMHKITLTFPASKRGVRKRGFPASSHSSAGIVRSPPLDKNFRKGPRHAAVTAERASNTTKHFILTQ